MKGIKWDLLIVCVCVCVCVLENTVDVEISGKRTLEHDDGKRKGRKLGQKCDEAEEVEEQYATALHR
jgi:hypothetical protein